MKRILLFFMLLFLANILIGQTTAKDTVNVKPFEDLTLVTDVSVDTSDQFLMYDISAGLFSYRLSLGELLKKAIDVPNIVGSSQIVNGSILDTDISGSAGIGLNKLATTAAGRLLLTDSGGAGTWVSGTPGYGLTISGTSILADTSSATGLVSKSRLTNALDDVSATGGIWEQENTNTIASANTTDNYHQGNIGVGDFSSNTIGGTIHAYAANMQMILSDSCSTDSCATPQILLRRGYNTSTLGRIGFLSTTDPHYYFQNNIASGRLLFQTNGTTQMSLYPTGQLSLPAYGDTTFTGTAVKYLAVTDEGLIIESDASTGNATISELTPAGSADSQGSQGDLAYDNNYLYVKTGAGWRRSALESWTPGDTILTYSPVVYLHADSIAGTSDGVAISSWPDLTANSTDFSQGTGGNQPLFRSTGINSKGAIDFDGTDDYMTSAGVSFTSDRVTIAMVVQLDNVPGATAQTFMSKSNSTNQFFAGINTSAVLRPVAVNGGSSAGYLSDTTATAGNTYIVVYSIDATTNTANIYVNGTLKSSVAGSGSLSAIADASSAYSIGANDDGTTRTNPTNGKIAVMAIYDAALTTSQMLNISTYLNNQYAAY